MKRNEAINVEPRSFTGDQLAVIKANLAIGATDEELQFFLEFCKASGLNPLTKEVWFIKTKERPQIMTGINGYWRIANEHPEYDGAVESLEFDSAGAPISARCEVYRKDRKYPAVGIALLKEYKKNTPVWGMMPSIMLGKCAASIAIRKAFPSQLGGSYTQEELPLEMVEEAKVTVTPAPQPAKPKWTEWYYDPHKLDSPERLQKACDYLEANGAFLDRDSLLYVSKSELKGAKEIFVGAKEIF